MFSNIANNKEVKLPFTVPHSSVVEEVGIES